MDIPDLDALPIGVVQLGPDGRVAGANAFFIDWCGMPVEGREFSELLVPVTDFLEGAEADGQMMISTADPARAVLVVRRDDADGGAVLTAVEASTRYASGLALRQSHSLADRTRARLELIIDASIAFASASTEERLGEILATTAARAYRAEQSAVFLLGEDGHLIRVAGTNPFEGAMPEVELTAAIANMSGVLEVSGIAEAESFSPKLASAMTDSGVHAVIAAPLHLDAMAFGFFVCFFQHPRRFDQEAAPLAEALAGQAAQTLATVRLQSRLEHAAMHDDTTGLPNRRFLEDQVGVLNGSDHVSVIFIDLDGFKEVNDALGHQLGDEVLREVARRLQATVREGDVVARYGGDEFVVVCAADGATAAIVAERIRDAVAQPIAFLPGTLAPSASIGVASVELNQALPRIDRLIRSADRAMYLAKSDGGNRVMPAP